uniref:Uncharacterized protein n=1 Tax=Arundo donax TaxID=35708 RepID=A0A0A9DWZ3_ARUDO
MNQVCIVRFDIIGVSFYSDWLEHC